MARRDKKLVRKRSKSHIKYVKAKRARKLGRKARSTSKRRPTSKRKKK